MEIFVQVLVTIVIGIANMLVVTMARHHEAVVIGTSIISIFILIFTWKIVNPPKKNPFLDFLAMAKQHKLVIISFVILILIGFIVYFQKNPSRDLSQYLGHPMNEILEVVPDYKLVKKDDGEIKYSAQNLSITGRNEAYLTRIRLSGSKSEYSFDGILLGMSHDDAVKELEKKGYVMKEGLSGNGWKVYRLKNTYIEIHFSDQWIDEMYCAAAGYCFDFSK